jgi:hypothetical protein
MTRNRSVDKVNIKVLTVGNSRFALDALVTFSTLDGPGKRVSESGPEVASGDGDKIGVENVNGEGGEH